MLLRITCLRKALLSHGLVSRLCGIFHLCVKVLRALAGLMPPVTHFLWIMRAACYVGLSIPLYFACFLPESLKNSRFEFTLANAS